MLPHECGSECESIHRHLLQKLILVLEHGRTVEVSCLETMDKWMNLMVRALKDPAVKLPPPLQTPVKLTALVWLEVVGLAGKQLTVDRVESGERAKVNFDGRPILLERWTIEMEGEAKESAGKMIVGSFNSVGSQLSLRQVYPKGIQVIRALYSCLHTLPSHWLIRQLRLMHSQLLPTGMRVCLKIAESPGEEDWWDLDESILGEGRHETSTSLSLPSVPTAHGTLRIQVEYRRQCKYLLEELEVPFEETVKADSLKVTLPLEDTSVGRDSILPLEETSLKMESPMPLEDAIRTDSLESSPMANLPSACSQSSILDDTHLTQFIKQCEVHEALTQCSTPDLREMALRGDELAHALAAFEPVEVIEEKHSSPQTPLATELSSPEISSNSSMRDSGLLFPLS